MGCLFGSIVWSIGSSIQRQVTGPVDDMNTNAAVSVSNYVNVHSMQLYLPGSVAAQASHFPTLLSNIIVLFPRNRGECLVTSPGDLTGEDAGGVWVIKSRATSTVTARDVGERLNIQELLSLMRLGKLPLKFA
jgi:hypothetical protein